MTDRSNGQFEDYSEEELAELRESVTICGALPMLQREQEESLKKGHHCKPIFSTPPIKERKEKIGMIGWFNKLFKKRG
ncbi:hypothetical protein [Endozoicomonas acroporae]|uniref:hypothetical protein n=1 Tax=Endozoicomonas acroporae TaxID=1701104 RepID=UPI0013D076BA|nr:hypothetical protein [Endozoicomonas acroporae]